MENAYNKSYAPYYDIFYKDKNYNKECIYINDMLKAFSNKKINSILDIGCGTGEHSLNLTNAGYKLTGIDLSEAMINIAREKSKVKKKDIDFHVSSMQDINFTNHWDAVICMFCAINYLIGANTIKKTLRNIHDHLNKDGLLLFDYRNGIPSLSSYSPTRVKWAKLGNKKILRISENSIDKIKQLFYTKYTLIIFGESEPAQICYDEHIMQYFFPLEIENYLTDSGFEIVDTHPFLKRNTIPSENDWNILIVAKAI
jgi:2-polyprenyl-3-methyl-5-hydroxy-6-metoxy-1,4-benzoquinol methylase